MQIETASQKQGLPPFRHSPCSVAHSQLDRQTVAAVSASERQNMNEHAKSRSGLQPIIGGS